MRKVNSLSTYNGAHSKSDVTLNSIWSYDKHKVICKEVEKEMIGTCYRKKDDNWVGNWRMNIIGQRNRKTDIYDRLEQLEHSEVRKFKTIELFTVNGF